MPPTHPLSPPPHTHIASRTPTHILSLPHAPSHLPPYTHSLTSPPHTHAQKKPHISTCWKPPPEHMGEARVEGRGGGRGDGKKGGRSRRTRVVLGARGGVTGGGRPSRSFIRGITDARHKNRPASKRKRRGTEIRASSLLSSAAARFFLQRGASLARRPFPRRSANDNKCIYDVFV